MGWLRSFRSLKVSQLVPARLNSATPQLRPQVVMLVVRSVSFPILQVVMFAMQLVIVPVSFSAEQIPLRPEQV
jgi:hypothetical protein